MRPHQGSVQKHVPFSWMEHGYYFFSFVVARNQGWFIGCNLIKVSIIAVCCDGKNTQ
jgi:hypothetical protein